MAAVVMLVVSIHWWTAELLVRALGGFLLVFGSFRIGCALYPAWERLYPIWVHRPQPEPFAWRRWVARGYRGVKWRDILRADPCSYCGGPGGTVDHIVPRARVRGLAGLVNLTGACPACNNAKGSQPALLFIRSRFRRLARVARWNGERQVRPRRDFSLRISIGEAMAAKRGRA